MNREITKEELINQLSESLAEIEKAIGEHPANTVALYEKAKSMLIEGQALAQETEWSRAKGLTLRQLAVMHQYLFANAFMSAWFHMHGDKERKEKSSSNACLLVSGLGFTPEDVLHNYLEYEQAFRSLMKDAGIGTRKHYGLITVGIFVVIVSIVIAWLALR